MENLEKILDPKSKEEGISEKECHKDKMLLKGPKRSLDSSASLALVTLVRTVLLVC